MLVHQTGLRGVSRSRNISTVVGFRLHIHEKATGPSISQEGKCYATVSSGTGRQLLVDTENQIGAVENGEPGWETIISKQQVNVLPSWPQRREQGINAKEIC